jgi:hypothetical protein
MSYEIFEGPNTTREINKFLRIEETIFLGPPEEGHIDIAEYFGIVGDVRRLKQENRKDVDGGFMEIYRITAPRSIKFDHSSYTFELYFHSEARARTVYVGKTVCPEDFVYFEEIEKEGIVEAKSRALSSDPYDRDGGSFYSK